MENCAKKVFEDITAKNIPKIMRDIKLYIQVHEVQRRRKKNIA